MKIACNAAKSAEKCAKSRVAILVKVISLLQLLINVNLNSCNFVSRMSAKCSIFENAKYYSKINEIGYT
jgi:hypothetical protein